MTEVHLSDDRTWNQTTTDRHDRSAQTDTTLQHSTVFILGQDCSVQIGRMQATKPTVGGAGHSSNMGGWEVVRAEGVVVLQKGGQGEGIVGAETKPPRDQSESPQNAGEERVQHPTQRREELHFLFEESVRRERERSGMKWEVGRGGGGLIGGGR